MRSEKMDTERLVEAVRTRSTLYESTSKLRYKDADKKEVAGQLGMTGIDAVFTSVQWGINVEHLTIIIRPYGFHCAAK